MVCEYSQIRVRKILAKMLRSPKNALGNAAALFKLDRGPNLQGLNDIAATQINA